MADDEIAESGRGRAGGSGALRQTDSPPNLLMPEAVMPRSAREIRGEKYGPTPRFLVYHLACELLVSREAIAWRLHGLGLIDRPTWLKAEWAAPAAGARAEAV